MPACGRGWCSPADPARRFDSPLHAGRSAQDLDAPRQTIAFVTHGIEESPLLADLVVVMTCAPGSVNEIIPVALPRRRDETSPGSSAALRAIPQRVREEQRRREQTEQT